MDNNSNQKIKGGYTTAFAAGLMLSSSTVSPASVYTSGGKTGEKPTASKNVSAATEGVMSYDERLIDAKLEAVEARTDTKFSDLLGEIKLIAVSVAGLSDKIGDIKTELDTVNTSVKSSKSVVIATLIGSALAIAALAYAAVAIFQGGMGASADAFAAGATKVGAPNQ